MNMGQDTLEAIIRRCPNLRVLKLAGLVQNPSCLLSYDRTRLYSTVAASCPMLKCFHFSLQGEYMDRKEAKALIDTFFSGVQSPKLNFMDTDNQYRKPLQKPMLSTLSIADADIRTENISHLFLPFRDSFFNQILTTLEVEPTIGTDYHDVGYILHDFLCTAPALLHVIAPTIPCYAEYLDLASTVPGEEEYCIPRNCRPEQQISGQFRLKKRMWACRGLQTLKIQFKSMIADSPSAENARIMFGYIARTCPKLRVLSIYRQDLDLKLDGGFCLLTKLERLERLMIQTDSKMLLKLKDVEWMARFPKKAKLPWLGNSHSTTSVHSISGHSSVSVRRNNSTTSKSSNGSGCHSSEPRELIFDGLGKFEDVDTCRRQLSISQGELGCWPMLEFLGIQVGRYKNERGETVKDNLKAIIENIRPDIEFSMDASRW
ncbi:hypothetical protein BGZ79_001599 [Entomortierella chlamydospora]|nr:hypothetical protein BGZ79_001599 [Entomortierella chlamydospora]